MPPKHHGQRYVNRTNGPNTWLHRPAMHAPGTYALIREAEILPVHYAKFEHGEHDMNVIKEDTAEWTPVAVNAELCAINCSLRRSPQL